MVKVNAKLQPNSGRTTNDPDPSGINLWDTSPGKELRSTKGKGNMEWVIEEGA